MLLTLSERFALLSVLPTTGDILTLKDIRKLREDLAVSQEDRNSVHFFTEFQCPQCKAKELFPAPVKCGECDVWMKPTGQVGCDNWEFERDILILGYLEETIRTTLMQMNENKTLEERHILLYEKFVETKE